MERVRFDILIQDQTGFSKLSLLLKKYTGINLPPSDKNFSLMASRLVKVLEKNHLRTYEEYHQMLIKGSTQFKAEFISSMTTNTTQFFREYVQLQQVKGLFSKIDSKTISVSNPLRIWCAASSTGQEVYSILILLLEVLPDLTPDRVKFLATDIDHEVLQYAARARYPQSDVQNMGSDLNSKYLNKIQIGGQVYYRVKSRLTEFVQFAPFNLIAETYPFKFKFDFVFCRNVLIYFDQQTVSSVISHIIGSMTPNGALCLGLSESGCGRLAGLESIGNSIFKLSQKRRVRAA